MNILTGRTILILSPQSWGDMFISKHHYAKELAKLGNKVYFLNPPEFKKRKPFICLKPSGVQENLWLIDHVPFFPYFLKFKALPLFHFLMKWQIKKILKTIPGNVDIVWSFDIGNIYPLKLFPKAKLKIFHPVDEPQENSSFQSAANADIIFSVTHEILQKYKQLNIPAFFINHGVAEIFLEHKAAVSIKQKSNIGFSGNLLRPDLDRAVILQIVKEHKDVNFHFWGSYLNEQSNIGSSSDKDQLIFIQSLMSFGNVFLYGPIPVGKLVEAYSGMDAFLICYDVQKDQSKGTNYHKIMEFLATGKVVISNNVSTYENRPDLIQMVKERDTNKNLSLLLKHVLDHLEEFNTSEKRLNRIQFASDNTYCRQIERINLALVGLKKINIGFKNVSQ